MSNKEKSRNSVSVDEIMLGNYILLKIFELYASNLQLMHLQDITAFVCVALSYVLSTLFMVSSF